MCTYYVLHTGLIVCRIEEEHLWESKQLGAHSPHVLLNTLVYFNTKHFMLRSVEEHLRLSFSHIMKHWKKNAFPTAKGHNRSVYLRYYAPAAGKNSILHKIYHPSKVINVFRSFWISFKFNQILDGQNIIITVCVLVPSFEYWQYFVLAQEGGGRKRQREEAPVFEQAENLENPLRCPVKLYEFYLSKWLAAL